MKNLRRRLICLVLSMVLVMSSAVFASAMTVSEIDPYLTSGAYYNWSGASGTHSIGSSDKLGSIVSKFYNGISLDLKAVDTHLNDVYTRLSPIQYLNTLNDLTSGWGTLNSFSTPTGYYNSWYAIVRDYLDEFDDDYSSMIGYLYNSMTDVHSILTNGIDINSQDLTDIKTNTSIWTTPTYYPFTYSYRTAINSNPIFYSSNTNGLNIGIRADETTGALKFASQTINNQADYLSLMHNDLMQLSMRMQTMGATYNPVVYDPDGNSYSYNAQSIMDALVTYGNNHGTMINDIRTGVKTLDSDINNITWNQNGSVLGVSINNDFTYLTQNTSSKKFTAYVNTDFRNTNLIKVTLPIGSDRRYDFNPNFEIGLYRNETVYPVTDAYVYAISSSVLYPCTDIYIYIPFSYSDIAQTMYINITNDSVMWYNNAYLQFAYVYNVKKETQDSYTVSDFIFQYNILDLFKQAKEMFFDDEALASKRANSSQTSAVLTNYTGSGSASASASDFGSLKDGVTTVKSGLNTNVSVSNVFSLFNSSYGFDFWTSETLSELNTVSITRRSGSDTPLYDSRLSEILNLMEVNDR